MYISNTFVSCIYSGPIVRLLGVSGVKSNLHQIVK